MTREIYVPEMPMVDRVIAYLDENARVLGEEDVRCEIPRWILDSRDAVLCGNEAFVCDLETEAHVCQHCAILRGLL